MALWVKCAPALLNIFDISHAAAAYIIEQEKTLPNNFAKTNLPKSQNIIPENNIGLHRLHERETTRSLKSLPQK